MRRFTLAFALLAALVVAALPAAAQTTVTQTTLSSAVALGDRTLTVASATGIAANSLIYIDKEEMFVQSISGTVATVTRGYDGTGVAPHASSAVVYVSPTSGVTGTPFHHGDPPIGGCTASQDPYSLWINTDAGRIWQCTGGQYLNVIDAYVFIQPDACNSSVSGNGTGTNGYTIKGTAPSLPVVQAQTDTTSTNTHYYMCTIPVPSRTNVVKAAYVVDVEFYYGVQTTGLGTQVATLSSGTMNSKTVFTTIAYPTPAASETATGLAEAARADAGSLLITPAVGSFNVATTTAGQFYSVKFTPATPFALATDRTQYLLTVSLLNTATSATITNSPGFVVHYRTLSAAF